MYNFPHQINDLAKLRAALSVFQTLETSGEDLGDDGVVGVAMAHAGVYAFRNKNRSLAENLRLENAKLRSSRGTETFARDIRRFFLLLGFVRSDLNGAIRLTEMGAHLLTLPDGSDEAHAVWRTALRNVALRDGAHVAHPYDILLRLVAARPGLEVTRLSLALEARNDSDEEFARILELADRESWAQTRDELGVTETHAANARKILPGLARQLGELRTDGNRSYPVEEPADRPPRGRDGRRDGRRARREGNRPVTAATIATVPRETARAGDEVEYADPTMTADLRRDRLERHQRMVRALAPDLEAAAFELFEDPYDTLAVRDESHPAILVEAKTLDGSAPDEMMQVRAAFAQLSYYEEFDVPADWQARGLIRVAYFEDLVSEGHIAFLESRDICVAWRDADSGELVAPPWSADILSGVELRIRQTGD